MVATSEEGRCGRKMVIILSLLFLLFFSVFFLIVLLGFKTCPKGRKSKTHKGTETKNEGGEERNDIKKRTHAIMVCDGAPNGQGFSLN